MEAGGVGVTGDDQYLQIRKPLPRLVGEVNAIHSRHGVIGYQQGKCLAGGEVRQRLVAVAGAHDIEAGCLEKGAGGHKDVGVVIDQQGRRAVGNTFVSMVCTIGFADTVRAGGRLWNNNGLGTNSGLTRALQVVPAHGNRVNV